MTYENKAVLQDRKGILWAVDTDAAGKPFLSSMRPLDAGVHEMADLFSASLMLYNVAVDTRAAMDCYIEILERSGDDQAVNAFQTIAANLNMACRAAEIGIRKLAEQ